MRQFDKYLINRLKNKEFEKSYSENCNICPTVLDLVQKALDSGKSWEELAEQTGLELIELERFAEADNCQKSIITTLCAYFGIEHPKKCPRFKFNDH